MAGSFHSVFDDGTDFNFAPVSLRMGWMLTSPILSGAFRGNFEALIEAVGASIYDGPGDVLAGAMVHLRYNYVQPGAKWVPYVQAGAGGLYTDAAEDESQRLIGSDFEFCLQAGVGLRYLFNERWALAAEAAFTHISNAGRAERNVGVNAVGGMLGVSHFF